MTHRIRFFSGLTGGAYTGRWLLELDPFTWPVGMGDLFYGVDLVVEDPTDSTYLYDVSFYSSTPQNKSLLIGGLTFDSASPPGWADDGISVDRSTKTLYASSGYIPFPDGTLWDDSWDVFTGPQVTVDDTLGVVPTPGTRALEVQVYEADGTYAGVLASDSDRNFLDDLSAEGGFGLQVKLGHADAALVEPDRLVRFHIDGTPRWQGVIEESSIVYADPSNREAGRVINVTGRGTLGLLEDAVVYPALGVGRISPETRYFNFASLGFDDTSWGYAVELKQQSNPAGPWAGAPEDWPDPAAYWVGPTDGAVPGAVPGGGQPGDIYLRGTYTVAVGASGPYRFAIGADDAHELYIDENKATEETTVGAWGGPYKYIDVRLDEGTHYLGIKGTNFVRPDPSTNVFAVICSVIKLDDGGATLGAVVARSSAGTKMLAFPATAPGMTPGHILGILLTEAQTRGTLTSLTWDFTATHDSNGTSWPTEIDVSFPVNTSLLDVVRHLVEEHACDVAMAPDSLTLHAYVSKGTDLSGSVAAEYAVNIGSLQFHKKKASKNVALSITAEGKWIETTEATSVSAHGRKEIGLSLGSAPSDDAADRQTAAFFVDNAFPVEVITEEQIEVVTVAPFVDFNTGDTISSTDSSGGDSPYRVTGIHVSEDDAGNPIYKLDEEAA